MDFLDNAVEQPGLNGAVEETGPLDKKLLDIQTAQTDPALLAALNRVRDAAAAIKAVLAERGMRGTGSIASASGEKSHADLGRSGPD